MSLSDIRLKYKQQIEAEIHKLLDLLCQTEQSRDVATSPIERAKYESEIRLLKDSIEQLKDQLKALEEEIEYEKKTRKAFRTPLQSCRVQLDDSLPEERLNAEFATEVQDLLCSMEYQIVNDSIQGTAQAIPPTFVAIQEGDFEPFKTLFQCIYGIVDENVVASFYSIYELNRNRLGLKLGIIITNTYIAPSARLLANQYQIRLLTFEELLNAIFRVTRYLKAKCRDYEQNNKLYHTYVEIKYLRRGMGRFADGRATSKEFMVTEASDGSSFEAKGELTDYVDHWLLRDGNSQLCILGEYGTGKTSFAAYYFYTRAKAYLENPLKNRIPLLVHLNRYHKSADIEQMMTDFLVNECGIRRDFDTFLKLAARGKLLIILDGFDEMAKQVDANVRRHNFREISRLLVGNNKVILLGRPNYFLTQAEIEEILSQGLQTEDPYRAALRKATSSNAPRYEILTIALFDRWQIEEFLKKQSEYLGEQGVDDWRELQRTIYETYNLEELARTPVLLEIIIKTISEIRERVSDINAAKLYQIYTDFWLNREYDEKGDVRWLITRKDKELFVLDLAWTMLLSDSTTPEIHFSKLSERVRSYFGLEKASEIEYFSSDIRFCSYLTHSETDGNYRFIHKSFMEYFAARRIYQALFDEQDVSAIVTDKPIADEVFFFLYQMTNRDEFERLQKLSREEKDARNKEFLVSLTSRILQQALNIYERRGALQPAEEWADRLWLYSEEFGFNDGKLWAAMAKGRIKTRLGQYAEAKTHFHNALSISEQMGDRRRISQSLIQIGTINQSLGDLDRALEFYHRALAIFEEIGDRVSVGRALTNVGTVAQIRGELDEALECYHRAMVIFEEIGDRASVGETLTNVSEIHQIRGDVGRALECSQRALGISREIGDRRGEKQALSQIGYVYQLTGRYEEAERIYQESLAIARETGDRQEESRVLSEIGSICTSMRRFTEAEKYYRTALLISQQIGDRQGMSSTLTHLGRIYAEMARYEEASTIFQESIAISEAIGDMRAVGISLYNLAYVYSAQSRLQESMQLYRESLEIFDRLGDLHSRSIVLHQLGMIAQKAREYEYAARCYAESHEIKRRLGDVRGEQDVLESLGDLAEALQNFTEAEKLYTTALEISQKLDDQRGQCELSVKLGKVAKRSGDTQKAIEYYGRYLILAQRIGLPLLADIVQEYDELKAQRFNPFTVGMPVRDEAFYGRNKELNELHKRILMQQNVMLIGERRIGKTSLLLRLSQRLELPIVSVYIDLQSFPGQVESLLNGVVRQTVEALLKEGLLSSERWEKFTLTYARDFVEALESIVDEAKEKLKGIKIVLILDEAERLLELGNQVAGVLRASLTVNRDVIAIISGTRQLLKLPEDRLASPLLNIFTIMTLEPLSKEDTESLIIELSRQAGISYDTDALERIFELSGGMPFYTQAIGYQLVELAAQKSKDRITVTDVNQVVPEVLERVSVVLQYNLQQLSDTEKAILSTISAGKSLTDAGKQDIRKLEAKGLIVEENGNYWFASALFEEWFKRQCC